MPTILDLTERIVGIDPPNRQKCYVILQDNIERFRRAWGSSHNHQAWPGGYMGHIHEVMRIAGALYPALSAIRPLPFSLSDALLVVYLHDLEKPWRFEADGTENAALRTKAQKEAFRLAKLAEYGIVLTPAQANALKYVEGEHDDYTNKRRVMNELAAFCHLCDVTSARIWHDHPK